MSFPKKLSRRNALKTGAVALAPALLTGSKAHAAISPKKAGETKVVYLGGDQLHNGMGQVQSLRGIFAPAGWRFIWMHDARYLTPAMISDADLLIITRWGGAIEAWGGEPVNEGSGPNDGYMTDEQENAIVDNVLNRGMGFMALHCTVWTPERQKFNDMMGIKGIMHGPVQTVQLHNFNQDHPITRGVSDFSVPLDENFGFEMTNPKTLKLFESTGTQDKRHDNAGWCIENGNGRVVGLVAGHTYTSWRDKTYQKLYWRGAHWAMKKEIPAEQG